MTGRWLAFFVLFAFVIRSWFAWDQVFGGSFVHFTETDAWYHLRLIENLLHHFPFPLTYDPYLRFPGGQDVNVAPGLDVLIAGLALLAGGGSPSPELVERVAAFVPPVLGALVVLPVYALGRAIFTARAGLFAAALAVVLPGSFLTRSLLGFVDHHVAEVLFSTVALLLFVRAAHRAEAGTWRRSSLAGVGLGVYLSMWSGGALLIVALTAGVWVHLVLEHLTGRAPARHVAATFGGAAATAAALVAVFLGRFGFAWFHLPALVGGMLSVLVLHGLSGFMARRGLPRWWLPVTCSAMLLGLAGLLWLLVPNFVFAVAWEVSRLIGSAAMQVGEATPLLGVGSRWPAVLFASFGLALPLALLALIPTVRMALDTVRIGPILLTVWFVVTLAAVFGQVRFGYYLAVPVAVLAGFGCDRILDRWARWDSVAFLLVVLFVFVPSAQLARLQAAGPPGPNDDWLESLAWMREHTPEPFGDPDVYFESYAGMTEARPYAFPASAYGVLSWWDPGYWIIRVARRIPTTNPTQAHVRGAAEFFLATDEARARSILDSLGVRYVITSSEMPALPRPGIGATDGQFSAMVAAAGSNDQRYSEVFYEAGPDGQTLPRVLYHPDYYRTMLTRLYVYGGQEAQPSDSTYVAVFTPTTSPSGEVGKTLVSLRLAASYADAVQAANNHPTGNARVVGIDPFHTCVPLEAVESLQLVHASPTVDSRAGTSAGDAATSGPSRVQVFEYQPGGAGGR